MSVFPFFVRGNQTRILSSLQPDVYHDFATTSTNLSTPVSWTWDPSVNCGNSAEDGRNTGTETTQFFESNSGNVSATFNSSTYRRFSSLNSLLLETDSSIQATCGQNNTAERIEISTSNSGSTYMTNVGTLPSTIWMGYSLRIPVMDMTNPTTLLQFRNINVSGSPRTQLLYYPVAYGAFSGNLNGLILRTGTGTGTDYESGANGSTILVPESSFQVGGWYDIVIELRLDTAATGTARVWINYAGATDSAVNLSYASPTASLSSIITSFGNFPHIRWGVYRHASADLLPSAIAPADQHMDMALSNFRMKFDPNNTGLGVDGFNAVIPRAA